MKHTLSLVALFVVALFVATPLLSAQENYALKMAAPSQAVLFNNTDKIPTTQIWTVELWVKRTAASNFSTLVDGNTSKLTLETWRAGNDWQHKVGFSKKGSGDKEFDYTAPLNQWVHLAFVGDGTSVSLYANGEFKGKDNTPIDLPLKGIGLLGNPNEAPNALIDELRMWNKALSVEEIKANMNQSIAIDADGLVGYWYFDDQTTNDLSTNGITGQNKGATYTINDNTAFQTKHTSMELVAVKALHQNEYLIQAGAKNQELLSIEVTTKGVYNPISLSSLNITLDGTTKLTDIEKIGIAYTGKNSEFAVTYLLTPKVNPKQGVIQFDKTLTLKPGTNYFWVVADIKKTAAKGNRFDATCPTVVVAQKETPTTNPNPTGHRTIAEKVYATSSQADIIPKPNSVTYGKGAFELNAQTKIKYTTPEAQQEAQFLKEFLQTPTGYDLPVVAGEAESNAIIFNIVPATTPSKTEYYKINVAKENITIDAQSRIGLFWAIQTLRQLFSIDVESQTAIHKTSWQLPAMTIEDNPRFEFRGMHLDVCRHFFPPSFVKRYIDILAMYKINKFHWHLTEDQGWRMEIKKYPKLQSVAAWRTCDGEKYGGYYTQEEMRDIVAYAAQRHITVIPELETPGHSVAVLSAYPELGCTSGPGKYDVRCAWGVSDDLYCAGKEQTFHFLEDVLTEMIDIFPSEYIHIGGDEAKKTKWATCTDCQKRKKDLNLNNEEELQKYFVERVAKFLETKGRKIIGWSEITHGGVPKNAIVQDWAPSRPVAKEAVQAGSQVIMSDNQFVYFDYRQTPSRQEQGAWWAWLGLDKVYGYEPIPGNFTANERKLVLGVEGCAWSEYMPTERDVEYMVLPRLLALSEVAWTPQNKKNYNDFQDRLKSHYARFDVLGYRARKQFSTPNSVTRVINSCEPITLLASTKGVAYYWNDEQQSVTPSIVVDKSGTYKCYVDVMGEMVENKFEVTIESPTTKPTVHVKKKSETKTLTVVGDYANYRWYMDGAVETAPFATTPSLTLPIDQQTDAYYLSGVHHKSATGSLKLDGKDDLFEIEKSEFLNNASAFTFESWVKVNRWRAWDVVMSKYESNNKRVAVEIGKNEGDIYAQVARTGNAYALAPNAVKKGEWFHIAVVYDGTATGNAQRLKIYINGQPQQLTFAGAAIPPLTPTVASSLLLGLKSQEPAMSYADVRYWNVARTTTQIAENMYALEQIDSSLKLRYAMDNVIGNETRDMVANTKGMLKNSTNAHSTDAPKGLLTYGCESQKWMVGDITGIQSMPTNTLGASLYPNPTDGKVTIQFPFQTAQNIHIRAYDMQGRELFFDKVALQDTATKNYDLSHLGKGIFFLTIRHDQQQDSFKIVLK